MELLELNMPVVNVYPAKSKVPAVNVVVALVSVVTAPANVVVPLGQLTVNAAIVLPLDVIVPVPTVVTVKVVYVPPALNVNTDRFNDVVPGSNAVVPKFNEPNQLPVVSVCIAVPDPVNVKLGALVLVPPVVPNVNVLVISAAAVKPPVPVKEKLVAVDINIQTCAAVVCANTILPDPNAIERTLLPEPANIPVVSVNPPIFNEPAVNV